MNFTPLFLFLISIIFPCHQSIVSESKEIDETLPSCHFVEDGICLPENYHKEVAPSQPMVVNVTIDVGMISEIDDASGTFDFLAWFNFAWEDKRLTPTNLTEWTEHYSGKLQHGLRLEWLERLWIPDLMVIGLKKSEISRLVGTTMRLGVLNLNHSNQLSLDTSLLLKVWCQMDFSNYPFDTQVCTFNLTSIYYQSNQMILNLRGVSEISNKGAKTNLDYYYTLKGFEENVTFVGSGLEWTSPMVGFELTLERHYIKHMWSYYFPTMIFVMVSWVSFMIPPEVIPGRMALLITLLLVLVNVFGTVIYTHQTKYLTLLDIWMISCIIFVCGALVAYAAILWNKMFRTRKVSHDIKPFTMEDNEITLVTNYNETKIVTTISKVNESKDKNVTSPASKIYTISTTDDGRWDQICIKLFPVAFLAFNLIYWTIVLVKK